VRGVDLDAVEAGALRAHGRSREGLGGGADVVERHRLGDDRLIGDLEYGVRDRRGRERHLAANVLPGVAAAMAELDRGLGAAGVDLAGEAGEARDGAVVVNSELAFAMAPGARR